MQADGGDDIRKTVDGIAVPHHVRKAGVPEGQRGLAPHPRISVGMGGRIYRSEHAATGAGRAGTGGVPAMERVAQDGSEKAAKTAGGTGSGVSGAAESRIGGHYATTVTGANYHADGRREEYIFYAASSEYKD